MSSKENPIADALTSMEDGATPEMKERAAEAQKTGGASEPGKTEPGKTEPGKTEPGKTEPGNDQSSAFAGTHADEAKAQLDQLIDIIDAGVVSLRRAVVKDLSIKVEMSENERKACEAAVISIAPALARFIQNSPWGAGFAFIGLLAANTVKLKNGGGKES